MRVSGIDMFAKIFRVLVSVLVVVLFVSIVFPAGMGSDSSLMLTQMPEYGTENSQTNPGFTPQPILTQEEPKMYYVVEDDSGEKVLVDVPGNLEEELVEEMIEEKLEKSHIQDEEPIEQVEEKQDEILDQEIEDKPEQEDPTQVVLHAGYLLFGYSDGCLFCEVNEALYFDASYLFRTHPISKYEWDFDGDGIYELESSSPKIYHNYDRSGLYNMRVRITYSYNYTYYPYYTFDTGSIKIPEGVSYNPWMDADADSYTTATVQTTLEYEIKVSVGCEEYGFPPILDFYFDAKKENVEPTEPFSKTSENDIKITLPVISPPSFGIWPEPPISIDPIIISPRLPSPQNSTNSEGAETDASLQNKVHVRMFIVRDEVIIPHFYDCVIEFDASPTKNINGEPKFFWDFGDGEYGEGIKVSHTYRKRGTYTATLNIDGWNCSISKTFVIYRGGDEPRLVIVSISSYSDSYLLCRVNEPLTIDITPALGSSDLAWCEWDFDGDEDFEYNTTSAIITKKFQEPGYYELNFRYTYSCTYRKFGYPGDGDTILYPTGSENIETIVRYYNLTYWFKVAVADKDDVYPPIPDFYVRATNSFSWWNTQKDQQDYDLGSKLKNVTLLAAFSPNLKRVNSWNSQIVFSANFTINPNYPGYDISTYHWDFGDGNTASGMEVIHTYQNNAIDYEVRLTVSNEIFNVSITRMVVPRPYSPNIYLYRETPCYDTIRVIVDGRVTKAVPEVELGSEIEWKDVWIENGRLWYKGKSYDFLYYEELIEPRTSEYGWILERDEQGRFFLNDEVLTLEELKEFFRNELKKTGLFDNEIEDFIDEWLGEGSRLFPGQKVFSYAIMYVPENVLGDIIQIDTEKDYEEVVRVHFLVLPADKNMRLKQPIYPEHSKGGNILHEWGVYVGEPILTEKENNDPDYWFDILFNGHEEYQINGRKESRIVDRIFEIAAEDQIIFNMS